MGKIEQTLISTKALAYAYGVTTKTIAEWSKPAKDGSTPGWLLPAKLGQGKYDLQISFRLYIENVILPKYARTDDDSESLDEAKRRKEISVANMKEMEERQMRGDLIDRDEAIKWVGGLVTDAKSAFMALPRRVAPVLYGKEILETEMTLRNEIDRILKKLSRVKT